MAHGDASKGTSVLAVAQPERESAQRGNAGLQPPASDRIARRSVLASVSAFFTGLFAPRGEPCDIVTSDRHGSGFVDCPRRAVFAYDEAAMDAVTRVHGPRHFCAEHVGCATLPLVRLPASNARAA